MKTKSILVVLLLMVLLSGQAIAQSGQIIDEFGGLSSTSLILIIGLLLFSSPVVIALYLNKGGKSNKKLAVTEHEKLNKTRNRLREDRRCPNCGRVIPIDARTCQYCSKKFW